MVTRRCRRHSQCGKYKKPPNLNGNTSQQHTGRRSYFCHFSNSHNCHTNALDTEHTSRQSSSPGHEFARSPPIDDIMNQLNPLHVTAYSFYFKTYRHMRLGLKSGLFLTTLVYVSYFPDACYMSGHSHPPPFRH
jgi:hypothetical protein